MIIAKKMVITVQQNGEDIPIMEYKFKKVAYLYDNGIYSTFLQASKDDIKGVSNMLKNIDYDTYLGSIPNYVGTNIHNDKYDYEWMCLIAFNNNPAGLSVRFETVII